MGDGKRAAPLKNKDHVDGDRRAINRQPVTGFVLARIIQWFHGGQ